MLLLWIPSSSWVSSMLTLAATVRPGGVWLGRMVPRSEPERCSVAGLLCSSRIVRNTMFRHKGVHMCTWHQDSLRLNSIIDFVVVSSNLQPHVLDTRVKRGAEVSTEHRLHQSAAPPHRENSDEVVRTSS